MDYGGRWAETEAPHHPPDPHHLYYAPPPQPQPQPQPLPPSSYSYYHYHPNQHPAVNPNPSPSPRVDNPAPSVAEAAALHLSASATAPNPYAPHAGYETAPYPHPVPVSSHYYGAGGGQPHGLAVEEAISHPFGYGPVQQRSIGLEPTIAADVKPPLQVGKVMHPNFYLMKKGKKGLKRITKVLQSVDCEVCKIKCNTQEVLKIHKQGKKHKKMLQKLQESISVKPMKAPTTSMENQETPGVKKDISVSEKTKKKDVPAIAEELEAKKRRVIEGGAAAEGVKVCNICNVVVNSPKVFEFHIAGQKHAAMVKKTTASCT